MELKFTKRSLAGIGITLGAIALLSFSACTKQTSGVKKGATEFELASDIPVGSKDAKVVFVEYASVMCPHCADFQAEIVPKLMETYVKTGKVRYVFREYPTSPIELASAGHLLGRCVAPDKREAVINSLMASQREIITAAQSGGVKQAFLTISASAGMSEAEFDRCMQDSEKLQTLIEIRNYANDVDKVEGTPTIIINGKVYTPQPGKQYEFPEIAKVIEAELASLK